MNYSRRQLYAMGETFGASATARLPGGGLRCGGGGGDSSSTTGATTTTTNTDERMALQDAVGINGDGNSTIYTVNSSDAVVAMANMGADVIQSAGGAVVDLYKNAGNQTADAWNTTIMQGAKLVDKLIDKAAAENSIASKVVDSFQPSENKNNDVMKWAAVAAAAVGVAYAMKGK